MEVDKTQLEEMLKQVAHATATAATAQISEKFDTTAKELRVIIEKNANASLQNHQDTGRRLDKFQKQLESLWKRVHGSDPPPPEGERPLPSTPILDQVSSHDLDIAGLRSDMIVVEKRLSTIQKAMGIKSDDERSTIGEFFKWIMKSREGQKFVLAGFAALTSLITALGTVYALATGRLPMPDSPRGQVIHEQAPTTSP